MTDKTATCACISCGHAYPAARRNLGYRTCLECGDAVARTVRHVVIPAYSKGAYQVMSARDVAHTNPKRTGG